MAEFKPTFLIVPGAWHPSSCYKTLAAHLKAAQFPVLIATHPSLNSAEPSTATTTQDAQAVREILLPLIDDQGKNIVLLTHSYGGVSGSAAAYGLSTASRAKAGKKGGILGIACIAAWLVPEGERLVDMLGGSDPPWLLRDQPSPGLGQIASPIDVFYSDLDTATALAMQGTLLPHAMNVFETPSPPPAWQEPGFEGSLAYLRCVQDKAVPVFVQDMMMEKTGVEWIVGDIDTSHFPFLSRPSEVTEVLTKWPEMFSKVKAND